MTPVFPIDNATLGYRGTGDPLGWIYRVEPIVASFALVATLPVTLAVGITIALLSRRSPLIRHTRVGWRGAPLGMLKFRTMWNSDMPRARALLIEDVADAVPHSKVKRDPRVRSRFAALCRRYSLDELPQIYHVARGEMSFVGPRPITRGELDTYYGPYTFEVLSLRPGITGLWQILGRSRLNHLRRRRLDVLLARRASPHLYFRILLRSIPKVLGGHDAY
ncbi:MAG: sugar transferase [Bryobacterales bacterium]|nr:sugar transferase [Bryobacterales bacterium]